jgi:uncharacterized membrane protein
MDIAALLGFLFSNPLVQGWFASRLTAGVKAAPFIPIQGGAKLRAVAVLLSVVAITVVGFLGQYLLRLPLVGLVDDTLERLPLIKLIYSSIKDVMKSLDR